MLPLAPSYVQILECDFKILSFAHCISQTPKRLIVNLQDLLVNQTLNASSENEHDSVTNVAVVKRDNDTTASAPIEHPAVIELKMEAADTPSPSPRIGTRGRAPKPGRPGRPSKAARKSQRRRTKSATSTVSWAVHVYVYWLCQLQWPFLY